MKKTITRTNEAKKKKLPPKDTFHNNKIELLRKVIGFLLIIIIINLFLVSLIEFCYPYLREYRDGSLIDAAYQFASGNNPYIVENSLPHMYTYGFLSPLLNAFVSIFLFSNFVLAQHVITIICMLALCYIVGKEIFTISRNALLVLVGLVIVLIYNSVSLRSEALAVFLTTITLYFVQHTKVITFKTIFLLSLIIIMLFYVKQYFVLLFPVLIIYFIFNHSKKILLYFIITTFVLGLASFLLVSKIFPLYFVESIVNHSNITGSPTSWTLPALNYVIHQSTEFIKTNWLIFTLFIFAIPIGLFKKIIIHTNITDMKKPLIQSPDTLSHNVYFIYSSIAIVILTLLLGKHGGAYMSYYYQLLPIPITLFIVSFWYPKLQKFSYKELVIILFTILFITQHYIYVITPAMFNNKQQLIWNSQEFHMQKTEQPIDLKQQNLSWENAISYIAKHNPEHVYLSPVFSIEAVKRGWKVYDNGQTEYYGANVLTPSSQQYRFLSPQNIEIENNLKKWQGDLNQNIANKKFSLIVLSKGYYALLNEKTITTHYRVKKTMNIFLFPYSLGIIEFWEPK